MPNPSNRVIITGGTGLIGNRLVARLRAKGYHVIVLSRRPQARGRSLEGVADLVQWDGKTAAGWGRYANDALAIINLAGETLATPRWIRAKKRRILQSRIDAGSAVVSAVEGAEKKPKVVIQASALDYYGCNQQEIRDETSAAGDSFLSHVTQHWELSTATLTAHNVRHVIIRSGMVLAKDGGALPWLMFPFRLFIGGTLGSGQQWFSWIHIDDEVRAITFLLEREDLSGVFNLTAPQPATMKDFCMALGRTMKRPCWLRVPSIFLRLFLGQMARELVLCGKNVIPKRLLETGFRFIHEDAESALREIMSASDDARRTESDEAELTPAAG
jgi:uncharacterized protein (TIGR01777 family)